MTKSRWIALLALAPLAALTARYADAAQQSVEDWKTRLSAHPILGKLNSVANETFAPVAIVVNEPQSGARRGYEANVVSENGPWLKALRAWFETHYAQPFSLPRRADREPDVVVILWSKDHYAPYAAQVKSPGFYAPEGAQYDQELAAVVTYQYGGMLAAPHWKRLPMMACYVQSLLDAHKASPGVQLPFFLKDGLGSYLGYAMGQTPGEFDEARKPDLKMLEDQVRMAHDSGVRRMRTLAIEDLFEPTTLAECRKKIVARVGAAAERLVKEPDQYESLHIQAWTFVHFLFEANGGKYRKPFDAYLESALKGDASAAAFRKALGGADLAVLDNEYYAWLFDTAHALIPNFNPDERALPAGGKIDPKAAPAPAASADPSSVAIGPGEIEAAHAALLIDIRAGKLEDSAIALESLRNRAGAAKFQGQIDRELVRVRKLIMARDQHLGDIAKGGKIFYEVGGKRSAFKVKSIADGRIILEDNKQGLAYIEIAKLTPYELAKDFSKSLSSGPDGWIKAYAFLLAGDDKAVKMLKGADGDGAALREDAESFYQRALALGEAANELNKLASRGPANDTASAKAIVESVSALCKDHRDDELVKKRLPALQLLAELSFDRMFEPSMTAEASNGKCEMLPDGRVKLTYEFDKKGELADFTPDHEYFKSWRSSLGDRAVAPAPSAEIAQGGLQMKGAACLRHAWEFVAPIKVTYEVGFQGLNEDPKRTPLFAVGALDDRAENFVWCQGFGSLFANHVPKRFVKSDGVSSNRAIEEGSNTKLELAVADGKITTRENGEVVKEAAGAPHTAGGVFLFVHSDPTVVFERLVIEAKPDTTAVRRAWVKRKLAEIGF